MPPPPPPDAGAAVTSGDGSGDADAAAVRCASERSGHGSALNSCVVDWKLSCTAALVPLSRSAAGASTIFEDPFGPPVEMLPI